MTSSDDDLSWVLRRELNAEAARLAAAHDGLGQIRAQLRSRPSVPVWGALWGGLRVDAERYGLRARHLAAEAADWIVRMTGRIPFLGRRDRGEGRSGARPGLVWLRPVLAVAAVCIFAGTAAAVPGLRHAITNIGSSGSGSTTSVTGRGGGSGLGTGHRSAGGNGAPGGQAGTTASATPSSLCDLHGPGQAAAEGQGQPGQLRRRGGEPDRDPGPEFAGGHADDRAGLADPGADLTHRVVRPHPHGHVGGASARWRQRATHRQLAPVQRRDVRGPDAEGFGFGGGGGRGADSEPDPDSAPDQWPGRAAGRHARFDRADDAVRHGHIVRHIVRHGRPQ